MPIQEHGSFLETCSPLCVGGSEFQQLYTNQHLPVGRCGRDANIVPLSVLNQQTVKPGDHTMPHRYDAYLRHAGYYSRVIARADRLYLEGVESMRASLALFDLERLQIDASWNWLLHKELTETTDHLRVIYAAETTYIGDLRYNKRLERIPQLEAALVAARRLGNRQAEGAFLTNLASSLAGLGDLPGAIALYEQRILVARELGD
jgi:hypothetical protein